MIYAAYPHVQVDMHVQMQMNIQMQFPDVHTMYIICTCECTNTDAGQPTHISISVTRRQHLRVNDSRSSRSIQLCLLELGCLKAFLLAVRPFSHPRKYMFTKFIYLAVYLLIDPSIHPSIHLLIYLSICLSVCLSIYLSIYLSIRSFIDASVCISIYPSIHPSIHPSIYLSICL